MSTPTLGPSLPLDLPTPPPLHLSSSYTSVISVSSAYSDNRTAWTRSDRTEPDVQWQDEQEEDAPQLREYQLEDLPYADVELDARKYRSPSFASSVLSLLRTLRVPSWTSHRLSPAHVQVHKISGALTNAVFFVSYPTPSATHPKPRTLLLRIYGPSSSALISRPSELQTLHILSSQYGIGPQVYGTFANGRVEQYFPSRTLTAPEVREREMSRWIGMRMKELHSVDLARVVADGSSSSDPSTSTGPGVWKNITSWLPPARDVLHLLASASLPPSHRWASIAQAIDLPRLAREVSTYRAFLATRPHPPLVFAHNDAQYGNLLRLTSPANPPTPTSSPMHAPHLPPHHRLIVVDFEYASPNPAAFDIANHFHEWCFDYSRPRDASWVLDEALYPSTAQRRNFYEAYLRLGSTASSSLSAPPSAADAAAEQTSKTALEQEMDALDQQVRDWSPASHAMWAVWGVVQARDDVLALLRRGRGAGEGAEGGEFDYLRYAQGRAEAFRRELGRLLEGAER